MLCEEKKRAWSCAFVAHALMTKRIDEALVRAGKVSLETYDVLLNLEMAPNGRLKMSELADAVLLSRSGLTRLIDRLEKKGYIQRHSCPKDRRATYAVLTPDGIKARDEAWPVFEEQIIKMFGNQIHEGEDQMLIRFYRRVLTKMNRDIC